LLIGVFAAAALAGHGATFLAFKTDGPVQARSRTLVKRLYSVVAILWPSSRLATWRRVNDDLFVALFGRPKALLAALSRPRRPRGGLHRQRRGRDGQSFAGSCAFLLGLLVSAAAALYPVMLRSSGDPGLVAHRTRHRRTGVGPAHRASLWIVAFPLAIGYLVFLFRLHRGKAAAAVDGEGTDHPTSHARKEKS